jgi:sigma-B regulation protein RsbU (phosphoserine phosphatase)
MFGKDRLREKIRQNAARSAREIVSALIQDFQNFIDPLPQKDDATLVVIKVEDTPS